jgi:hypothetical protein
MADAMLGTGVGVIGFLLANVILLLAAATSWSPAPSC